MFEPDTDYQKEEEELLVQGRLQVHASEWYVIFPAMLNPKPPRLLRFDLEFFYVEKDVRRYCHCHCRILSLADCKIKAEIVCHDIQS